MSGRAPIRIEALVDAAEHAGLVAGAEQLSEALGAASGGPAWPVSLTLRGLDEAVAAEPAPDAIIASLLPETGDLSEPIAATEARWRRRVERLQATGAPVFVCTVFRHVRQGAAPGLRERIRRLDRMAVELSHTLGVAVVDFDRAMAHIGARALNSDYRLSGVLAAEVAGHTIAWSLLSYGLDQAVDPTVQERARAALGGLQQIDALVSRRLAARAAARG
jgi:hypothetical protein